MQKIRNIASAFMTEEDGATMIEYGLLAALIALAVAGVAAVLGGSLNNTFNNVDKCVSTPNSANC